MKIKSVEGTNYNKMGHKQKVIPDSKGETFLDHREKIRVRYYTNIPFVLQQRNIKCYFVMATLNFV